MAMSTDAYPPSVSLLSALSPQSLEGPTVPNVPVGSATSMKLDNLGPMVVNNDGTLSRIANWENMTEAERGTTMRVIAARNRARLAKQQPDGSDPSESTPLAGASGF